MSALWHTTNRFRYLYPTPVTGAMTCLRVLPRVRHGLQRLVSTRLWIDPQPRAARSWSTHSSRQPWSSGPRCSATAFSSDSASPQAIASSNFC